MVDKNEWKPINSKEISFLKFSQQTVWGSNSENEHYQCVSFSEEMFKPLLSLLFGLCIGEHSLPTRLDGLQRLLATHQESLQLVKELFLALLILELKNLWIVNKIRKKLLSCNIFFTQNWKTSTKVGILPFPYVMENKIQLFGRF